MKPGPKKLPIEERFARHFIPEPNSGCWLWLDSIWQSGYGGFQSGSDSSAHRNSWTIYRGRIPKGYHVLHSCNTRCCVNPEHLYLGKDKQNAKDRSIWIWKARAAKMGVIL